MNSGSLNYNIMEVLKKTIWMKALKATMAVK